MPNKKDKKKNLSSKKENINALDVADKPSGIPPGTRRVIIGGKPKYIPINPHLTANQNSIINTNDSQSFIQSSKSNIIQDEFNDETDIDIPIVRKTVFNKNNFTEQKTNVPSGLARKMENHKSSTTSATSCSRNKMSCGNKPLSNNKSTSSNNPVTTRQGKTQSRTISKSIPDKKMPTRYAQQIEKDIKKQTIKSAKNFSDLRKIKAMQDIDTNSVLDANRASVIELRKLRIEQRKMDQEEAKKRAALNKRETAVQAILRNENMSKFSKAVAIKNLSIGRKKNNAPKVQL